MAEHPEGGLSNPDTDYERTDIALAPIALAALALLLLLGVAPLVILAGFPSSATDVDRRLAVLPPAPRLQIDPRADLARYMAREQRLLSSYGWVDRAHGTARIPLREAMRRAVQTGIAGFPKAGTQPP
jgi:hypothetical protein